jgi:hypothetical protein
MGDEGATATSEAAPFAEVPAEAGYPSLQSVPPRPQLSYTIQQQRQIVEALIADRENARYTSQVVRHRSGLSSLPPPPTPPEPAPPITIEPAIASPGGTGPKRRRLVEQETLVDFLSALLSDEPAEPDLSSPPEALPETLDEPTDGSDRQVPKPASTAGASASPADVPLPPDHGATAARRDAGSASSDDAGQAPAPPARSAVAARLAAGSDVIDDLVDETVPQAPLPPGQSALAARLAAAQPNDAEARSATPLPAPRPAIARSAAATLPASLPAPPPIKPVLPVSSPMPPRPAERPAEDRSAAADGVFEWEIASSGVRARAAALMVANTAS